jgi:hypothetical protein
MRLLAFVLLALGMLTVEERLAKWRIVEMPYDAKPLRYGERQTVDKLVDACRYLDDIYWRQNDPGGLEIYRSSRDPRLRRLLMIHGGRYDLLDGNSPFADAPSMPPGRNFYPQDLTRAEIEKYVAAHPEKKAEIYDPYTVVRRRGEELVGIPYHVEYRGLLERAARRLREAAGTTPDKAFASFLRLRAQALLNDDYTASDFAWLDLKNPKIDVTFAPYETYEDGLLGVKASYGCSVLIRNEAESRKLDLYQSYVPDLQEALPLGPEDLPSKRGRASPMAVADSPYRGGDLRHGYQAVANNLPNDPKILEEKGSKKTFFKNFLDARVNYVIVPIAKRLMRPSDAGLVTGEGYLAGTLMHEIAHGLGPAWARRDGKRVDIREAIGAESSGLEEAKADAVGMFGLKWLADRKKIPAEDLRVAYASQVAGLLRTLRFGAAEAHAVSELMQFNYLRSRGAIAFEDGRYGVDYERMPEAMAALARELLEIEASGDAARAGRWFAKYRGEPPELREALASIKDIPVDIDPVFSFPDRLE